MTSTLTVECHYYLVSLKGGQRPQARVLNDPPLSDELQTLICPVDLHDRVCKRHNRRWVVVDVIEIEDWAGCDDAHVHMVCTVRYSPAVAQQDLIFRGAACSCVAK